MFGKLTRIATGNLGRPRLSADGSTVVYTRWNGKDWDIERHRNGEMEAVSKHPGQDTAPYVSDDGEVVVWSRMDPESGNWDVMRWQDRQETAVANSPANEMEPHISGDGQTVVYTYDDPDKTTGFDIHICDSNGCRELTSGGPVDREALVADNGKRVIFRRKVRFDGGDLWIHDENGTVKPFTHDGLSEQRTAISGDAKRVAWSKSLDGENEDIYLRDLATGEEHLIGLPDFNERDPILSSDGSLLAFSRSGRGESNIILWQDGRETAVTDGGHNSWPDISDDGSVVTWAAVDPEDSSQRVVFKLER